MAVDIILSQIGDFLGNMKISRSGQTFIMERSGALVGSSTQEKPYTVAPDGKARRLLAIDSKNLLTNATAKHIINNFNLSFFDLHQKNRISPQKSSAFCADIALQRPDRNRLVSSDSDSRKRFYGGN